MKNFISFGTSHLLRHTLSFFMAPKLKFQSNLVPKLTSGAEVQSLVPKSKAWCRSYSIAPMTWIISGSKIHFWSTVVLSNWIKSEFSSSLKVDQKWVFGEKFGWTKSELICIRVKWLSPSNFWTGPTVGLSRSSLFQYRCHWAQKRIRLLRLWDFYFWSKPSNPNNGSFIRLCYGCGSFITITELWWLHQWLHNHCEAGWKYKILTAALLFVRKLT